MRPAIWVATASLVYGIGTSHAETELSPPVAFELDLQTGAALGQHTSGLGLSVAPRLRYRVLTLGVGLQGVTGILDGAVSLSAVGGLALTFGRLRVDAMSELGVNRYWGVDSSWIGQNPGASATLPFAGGRAALSACVSCNPEAHSFWLGISAHYDRDLYSDTNTYSYIDVDNEGSEDEYRREVINTVRIGQARLAVLATVTFTFLL